MCHLNVGPRFLAGDLNELSDSLPAFDIIRAAGFQDIQEIALARWGYPIQPTCKHVTRKDFFFISPELAALLLDVRVKDDVWPDHAVVEGVFSRLSKAPPRRVWPSPSALPWPKQFEVPEHWWDIHTDDPTSQYVKLWNMIETTASAQLPFVVPRHQLGRGATLNTKCAAGGRVAPTKRARMGEFQPNSTVSQLGMPNGFDKCDVSSRTFAMSVIKISLMHMPYSCGAQFAVLGVFALILQLGGRTASM